MLIFEHDENKSEQNLAKHDIYFDAAQVLGNDPDLLVLQSSVQFSQKHWSVIIAYRGNNIQTISVRHSRIEEWLSYES